MPGPLDGFLKRLQEKQEQDKQKVLEPLAAAAAAAVAAAEAKAEAKAERAESKPLARSRPADVTSFRYNTEVSGYRKDRTRGDIIISAKGIVRNYVQRTKQYPMDSKPIITYTDFTTGDEYRRQGFPKVFDQWTEKEQTEFLAKNTVEIIYDPDNENDAEPDKETHETNRLNGGRVLDVLRFHRLGPNFITKAKKIVLKIVIPDIEIGPESLGPVTGTQFDRRLNHKNWGPEPYPIDPTSHHYKAVAELVSYLNTCGINPEYLHIVLDVPRTPSNLPELFLDHVFLLVPFYQLHFTKWTANYRVRTEKLPQMDLRGPVLSEKNSQGLLLFVSRWALDRCQEEYNRVLDELDN